MFQIDEAKLNKSIVDQAVDQLLDEEHLSGLVAAEVKVRVDAIFKERAQAQIHAAVDEAIKLGFERDYQRVDAWGKPQGEKTSIKKELDKIANGYWNCKVEPKTGKPTDSSYGAVTRAEFLMTQICADDFTKSMKDAAISITGALKDGLRNQMAAQMDNILSGLFHVKSLQDQGKVEKPY